MVYYDQNQKKLCGLPVQDILIQHDSSVFYQVQRNLFEKLVEPLARIVRFRADEKFSHMDHVQIAGLFERLLRYFFTGTMVLHSGIQLTLLHNR